MSSNLYSIVEVAFQAILKGDHFPVSGLAGYAYLKKPLVDKFMVVCSIFFASMVYVHLQGEAGKLELFGNEGEGL